MEIFPEISRKPLSKCEPGELLLLRWGSDLTYAFVARNQDKLFLAFLCEIHGHAPPRYTGTPDASGFALSYGKSWRIEIDHDAANVDISGQKFYDRSGVLILESDRYLLRVAPFPQSQFYSAACFDITAGTVADEPRTSATCFLKWSLMVSMGDERFRTLLSFPVEKKA